MIAVPPPCRPAIVIDDRLPLIEYEPVTRAEVVAIAGDAVTDDDYKPLPGERRQGEEEGMTSTERDRYGLLIDIALLMAQELTEIVDDARGVQRRRYSTVQCAGSAGRLGEGL